MVMTKPEQDKFTEQNLGLVHMCAKRFLNRGIEYEDLYSTGCIGLCKAVRAFDESRGFAFSTYAVPVILGEMKRLFRDGGAVRVSRSLKSLSLKITAVREKFLREHDREPNVKEISDLTGAPFDDVIEAISAAKPVLSLTVPDDNDDDRRLDLSTPPPDNSAVDLISLRQVITFLTKEEQEVVTLRFFKGLTQLQAAKIIGTNQVQISRIEKRLLQKLKNYLME
ncbi:MAG: sigma-70 family RNA polymerase sigma factor [Ruminococcus sp.]|jgi:RNA polymerase sporulation-specific sigma factor|nr:sigma-70 family RNA polymerase sigma factor [Ruminococcus sp.]